MGKPGYPEFIHIALQIYQFAKIIAQIDFSFFRLLNYIFEFFIDKILKCY